MKAIRLLNPSREASHQRGDDGGDQGDGEHGTQGSGELGWRRRTRPIAPAARAKRPAPARRGPPPPCPRTREAGLKPARDLCATGLFQERTARHRLRKTIGIEDKELYCGQEPLRNHHDFRPGRCSATAGRRRRRPGTGNHDRIPDRWERAHHLSLRVNQARRDQDHDGLRNRAEFRAHTNPRKADTDGDGIKDGAEHAGKIASFTGGVLTINLFGGKTLTGTVDDTTEIECDDAHASDDSDRGDDHGDHHGDDPGDDGDEGASCDMSALTPGAVVKEAELHTRRRRRRLREGRAGRLTEGGR